MKLTFELRKKNLDKGEDKYRTSDDYFVSTDYDSEEESRKLIFSSHKFKCEHCSKILRGIHSLKNHCKRKHGNHEEKNVLCDKCPTRFYTDFEFNRHYQTHYSVKNYLCHLCSKKFVQKSTLDLHLRYHKNDRRYQCEVCRKKFFTNNHLKRHCLTHTNQRDFKCEPCNRSFRYKDHLRRHLQSVHIGVRSHYCRECQKPFMYLSQLKFHEQSHTGMPYSCRHCLEYFKKKISLKMHMTQCKKRIL